jgi:putative heme transporter
MTTADGTAPRRPEIPGWILKGGAVAWRLVAMAAAVIAVAYALRTLTVIVVPIAVALLLAGVLEPLARRLHRDRFPDWLVPLVLVLGVLGLLVAGVAGLGVRLADQLPTLRDEFSSSLQDVEDRFSVQLPDLPGSDSSGSSGGTSGRLSDAAEIIRLGAEVLFGAFLTLALAFLFLKDGRDMWAWFLGKLDSRNRDEIDAAGRAAWDTLGTYVRGLTVVALIDAAGIGIGLLVLGVPLVVSLAALQFVASYVPTIGAFVAGAVAAVVAFGTGGFTTAALTVALVVVVQQIGNDVIEPWIMGRTLSIHPAVVLIAVSAGAIVWGIPGALLFVPMVAAGSAAGHVLWERRHPET